MNSSFDILSTSLLNEQCAHNDKTVACSHNVRISSAMLTAWYHFTRKTAHLWQFNVVGTNKNILWPSYSARYFKPIRTKFQFSQQFHIKSPISKFTESRPVGTALINADGRPRRNYWALSASMRTSPPIISLFHTYHLKALKVNLSVCATLTFKNRASYICCTLSVFLLKMPFIS
jgi:hypothetical protein